MWLDNSAAWLGVTSSVTSEAQVSVVGQFSSRSGEDFICYIRGTGYCGRKIQQKIWG